MEFPTIWNMEQKTHIHTHTHLGFWFKVHLIRMGLPSFGWKRWPQFNFWPAPKKKHIKTDNTNGNINPHAHEADMNKYVLFAGFPWNTAPPDLNIPLLLSQTYVLQPVRYLLHFYISAAETHPLAEWWCNGLRWQRYNIAHPLKHEERSSGDTWQIRFKTTDDSTSWTPGLWVGCPISQPLLFRLTRCFNLPVYGQHHLINAPLDFVLSIQVSHMLCRFSIDSQNHVSRTQVGLGSFAPKGDL